MSKKKMDKHIDDKNQYKLTERELGLFLGSAIFHVPSISRKSKFILQCRIESALVRIIDFNCEADNDTCQKKKD